jgi:capsular exopolysaccharide synthesis family protein
LDQNIQKEEKLFDLGDYKFIFKALLKWWYVIVFSVLVLTTFGVFRAYVQPKTTTARLQLLLQSGDVYNYQSSIYKSVGYLYTDISNQMRVLKSYDLIEKVVKKLDLNVSYYIVGRLKTQEVFHGVPFKVRVVDFNKALIGHRLSFKVLNDEEFEVGFDIGDEHKVMVHKFNENIITPYYVIFVDSYPGVEVATANYEVEFHKDSYWVSKIQGNLQISNEDYTSVLTLTLTDEISARSTLILDSLASEYLNYTLKSQFDVNENTMTYINKQIDEVTLLMDSIESEYDTLRDVNNVLNLDLETQKLFEKLFSLRSEKVNIENKILTLNNLETFIQSSDGESLLPPSVFKLADDNYLESALSEFYKKQIQMNEMKSKVKTDHLGYQNLVEGLLLMKSDILVYINNAREAFKTTLNNKVVEIASVESLLEEVPETERDFSEVGRNLSVNEKLYMYLLEKRANTFIARSGIVPSTKVIEKARVVQVNQGDVLTSGGVFGAIGLAIGIGLCLGIYFLFGTYENVKELKDATKLPVLGAIPFKKGLEGIDNSGSKSNMLESLRGIRTSLSYSGGDQCQVFMVSSVHPGEGKTFVSGSLASIYAQSGKRTLLIDFDLHKPRVHRLLKLDNSLGNSSYLSSQSDMQSVIQNCEEGFDVLPAGPVPPNPSELVLSKRVTELIEFGKQNYDVVFVDTPPVGLISDGVVLIQQVDFALFVMNTRMATKKGVKYLEEIINDTKVKHKGLVLN